MTTAKSNNAGNKNKKGYYSNVTLSGSITRVLTIALVVVFTIIIGVAVTTINITLSEAIKTTADSSANSISLKVLSK